MRKPDESFCAAGAVGCGEDSCPGPWRGRLQLRRPCRDPYHRVQDTPPAPPQDRDCCSASAAQASGAGCRSQRGSPPQGEAPCESRLQQKAAAETASAEGHGPSGQACRAATKANPATHTRQQRAADTRTQRLTRTPGEGLHITLQRATAAGGRRLSLTSQTPSRGTPSLHAMCM